MNHEAENAQNILGLGKTITGVLLGFSMPWDLQRACYPKIQ